MFLALGIVALITIALPFRVVNERSPYLRLAPFGFSYQGAPLTGMIYGFHDAWRVSRFTMLKQGKLHGVDQQWYLNSQQSIERHYEDGLEVGVHKAWYEDGKVRFLKNFVKGVAHGEFYEWHENGQLAQFVIYDFGREVAAKSWTAGGKPFYNYVWDKQKPIGLRGDTYCSPRKIFGMGRGSI